MKAATPKSTRKKVLKARLAQTKAFKKEFFENQIYVLLAQIKKAMKLIYQLDQKNKSVVFIGPSKLAEKYLSLTRRTQHSFVSDESWESSLLKRASTTTSRKHKPKASSKNVCFSLMVILGGRPQNCKILRGAYSARIPTIKVLYENDTKLTKIISYKIDGGFKESRSDSIDALVYSLIKSTLRKGRSQRLTNKSQPQKKYVKLPKKKKSR